MNKSQSLKLPVFKAKVFKQRLPGTIIPNVRFKRKKPQLGTTARNVSVHRGGGSVVVLAASCHC